MPHPILQLGAGDTVGCGYSLGTLIGLVPFSLHNVYLGSLAASLVALDDRVVGRTPVEWTIYGVGFLGTVAAVITLNRIARRALARYQALPAEEEQ